LPWTEHPLLLPDGREPPPNIYISLLWSIDRFIS
jgi:hypothetical protein